MLRLRCPTQSYAWGKLGENSLVGVLKMRSDEDFVLENTKPYAELWMGTHSSGPAMIDGTEIALSDWLRENRSAVGYVPPTYTSDSLPFLLKVLSVRTALSIQAHPNISLAQKLHQSQPQHYKDANHKPEMSIALTPFEALCGFREIGEIRKHLVDYPELGNVIGADVCRQFQSFDSSDPTESRNTLQSLFTSLMEAPDATVAQHLEEMIGRISRNNVETEYTQINSLIQQLFRDYPNDRGVFCPLILNYLRIRPGDAFFMGPNEPHAYISGDCVECMALSDNTVRAGLTPKHRDVETLCQMLHYKTDGPPFCPTKEIDEHTTLFRPPVDVCAEFEVERLNLEPGETATIRSVPCASIFILVTGSGSITPSCSSTIQYPHSLRESSACMGSIYFLAADTSASITANNDEHLTVYRAHVNLELLEQS